MKDLDLGKWNVSLKLALEAYNAGSMGIAAAIYDSQGNLVAQGRNQLKDNLDSGNALKMTSLAHAEMNALNNLPLARQKERDLILYTTVEPCPMCLGAVVMSRIRKVMIGSADPWAGSMGLLEKDEYLQKKKIEAKFESGKVEELCFALHYLSLKRDAKSDHPIFERMQSRYPVYTKKLDELLESGELILDRPLTQARLLEVLT